MIKVKHLMDPVEGDDGARIWVEPIGLAKDLREWCQVHHVLPHLGPPMDAWRILEHRPDAYEYFRGRYHDCLCKGPYKKALQELACVAMRETFTLVHQGADAERNTAQALYEYLTELEAYCPPEGGE